MLESTNISEKELLSRTDVKTLKGFAILMIICQHIGQAFHISLVNPLGPIGVFVFLYLSGYGLMCSYKAKGLSHYFSRRIFKVYLPYVVTVILFLLFEVLIGNEVDEGNVPKYLVLLELPQGSYWYLLLLFYWYIVFFFLSRFVNRFYVSFPLMCIFTLTIIIITGFNRNYVWQFATFPLGIFSAVYPEHFKRLFFKIRNLRNSIFIVLFAFFLIFLALPGFLWKTA